MALTQKDVEDYKQSLKGKTKEELLALEQEIVAECERIDKEVAEKTFDLPTENYVTVAEAIKYFLNKQQVQWQYTLAMVGMYDFWGSEKQASIPYAQLDTILRTLGGLQFTGYEEWVKVIAINKYFEPLREAYMEVTGEIYDAATKHQVIQEALGLSTPLVQGQEA
jgi:hypothetical protein